MRVQYLNTPSEGSSLCYTIEHREKDRRAYRQHAFSPVGDGIDIAHEHIGGDGLAMETNAIQYHHEDHMWVCQFAQGRPGHQKQPQGGL